MRPRRGALAIALAVLALPVAACGGGGGDPDPAATVRAYVTALDHGDAATVCAQFTDESRHELARFGTERLRLKRGSCPATIRRLLANPAGRGLRGLAHRKITVGRREKDRAEVRIAGLPAPVELVHEKDGWRISSRPTGESD